MHEAGAGSSRRDDRRLGVYQEPQSPLSAAELASRQLQCAQEPLQQLHMQQSHLVPVRGTSASAAYEQLTP